MGGLGEQGPQHVYTRGEAIPVTTSVCGTVRRVAGAIFSIRVGRSPYLGPLARRALGPCVVSVSNRRASQSEASKFEVSKFEVLKF